MQLSASPAPLAPLSAAFIAPDPTAAPVAGVAANFAQVFASLDAIAAGPQPAGNPAPVGAVAEPVGAVPPTPETPAAVVTCAAVRTLYRPIPSKTLNLATGPAVELPAGLGGAAEIDGAETPAPATGRPPGSLPASGRKPGATRGDAGIGGAVRAKSTALPPALAEEPVVTVAPLWVAPVVVAVVAPPPVGTGETAPVVPSSTEVGTESGSTESPDSAAPAGTVASPAPVETVVGAKPAARPRRAQPGAMRLPANGAAAGAGQPRWLTTASGTQEVRVAGRSDPVGVVSPAGPESDVALATAGSRPTESSSSDLGRIPLGFVSAEFGPAPSSTTEVSSNRAPVQATEAPVRPGAPVAPAPAEALTSPRPVAAEAIAPVSAGAVPTDRGLDRATWLTQETVVAPSLDLPEEVDDDSDNSLPDLPTAGSAAEDSLAGFGSVDWTRAPRALAGKADVAGRRSQLPENIADRLPVSSRADIFASDESRKHIESSAGKALVSSAPTVGTHVAKAQGFMPTAPAIPSAVDATQPSRVEFSVRDVSGTPSATSGESAPAEAIPLLAGKAVEAVLQAADRLAAGDRSSVRLEFAMGDSELSVRVALRDNAVRATFQTDSPELRAALVHEWQAVTAEPRERTFQFAPPAFQSSQGDSWSQGNLTGEFSRQQRDGQPAHAGEREFTGWSTGRNDPDSGEPAVSEPGRGRAELPAYSQHLHTLA